MNLAKLEAKLAEITNNLQEFDGQVAKVGWFPSAKYEDGTPVAQVAMIQEFGAPAARIPPRPFFRPTIDEKKAEWVDSVAKGARAVAAGRMSAYQVLEAVGQKAAGDVRYTISRVDSPPLSPVTLLLRKWRREGKKITGKTVGQAAAAVAAGADVSGVPSQPLNDTGLMLATLTSVVGREE